MPLTSSSSSGSTNNHNNPPASSSSSKRSSFFSSTSKNSRSGGSILRRNTIDLKGLSNHKDKSSLLHNKDKDKTANNHSDGASTRKIFGQPLVEANKLASSIKIIDFNDDYCVSLAIPSILKNSLDYLIFKNYYEKEGVFRVGGNIKRIKFLENTFNSDPGFNIMESELKPDSPIIKEITVYDVATLLKRYLNGLPDSIIPAETSKELKSELEKIMYKDLLIFSQSATENISLKITGVDEQEVDNDSKSTIDTEHMNSNTNNNLNTQSTNIKSSNSSVADLADDPKKNKNILVVDVNSESDMAVSEVSSNHNFTKSNSQVFENNTTTNNSDDSKSPELTVYTNNFEALTSPSSTRIPDLRKSSHNSEQLLKALNSVRPVPPKNFRKHSLMSVMSTESGITDSKSLGGSFYHNNNSIYQIGSASELTKLPYSVKQAVESFIDYSIPVILEQLVDVNIDVFLFVLKFLALLSENYEKTKMNSFNLSKIFQTSFFLNTQLSGNLEIIGNSLKKMGSNTNSNRLSVSINTNQTYNSNKLQPSYTRNSIISTNSGISGLSSVRFYGNNDTDANSSSVGNNLTIPHHMDDNFSLESFNSINVDYNVNQLILKIYIDNFDLLLDKLFKILVVDKKSYHNVFKSKQEINSSSIESSNNSISKSIISNDPSTPIFDQPSEFNSTNPTTLSSNSLYSKGRTLMAEGFSKRTVFSPISEKSYSNSIDDNKTPTNDGFENHSKVSLEDKSFIPISNPEDQHLGNNSPKIKKKKLSSIFLFLQKNKKKSSKLSLPNNSRTSDSIHEGNNSTVDETVVFDQEKDHDQTISAISNDVEILNSNNELKAAPVIIEKPILESIAEPEATSKPEQLFVDTSFSFEQPSNSVIHDELPPHHITENSIVNTPEIVVDLANSKEDLEDLKPVVMESTIKETSIKETETAIGDPKNLSIVTDFKKDEKVNKKSGLDSPLIIEVPPPTAEPTETPDYKNDDLETIRDFEVEDAQTIGKSSLSKSSPETPKAVKKIINIKEEIQNFHLASPNNKNIVSQAINISNENNTTESKHIIEIDDLEVTNLEGPPTSAKIVSPTGTLFSLKQQEDKSKFPKFEESQKLPRNRFKKKASRLNFFNFRRKSSTSSIASTSISSIPKKTSISTPISDSSTHSANSLIDDSTSSLHTNPQSMISAPTQVPRRASEMWIKNISKSSIDSVPGSIDHSKTFANGDKQIYSAKAKGPRKRISMLFSKRN